MACPDCGSWSVKADRSLSGRMVCGSCGRPLGIRSGRGSQGGRGRGGGSRRRWQGRPPLTLVLLLALGCGALITVLSGPRQEGERMWRSPDSSDPERERSGIMFRNIAP